MSFRGSGACTWRVQEVVREFSGKQQGQRGNHVVANANLINLINLLKLIKLLNLPLAPLGAPYPFSFSCSRKAKPLPTAK